MFSLLSPVAVFRVPTFFFLLKNVITEALPLSLIGSALAGGGSVLEPAGMGSLSLEHRGSFQQLLTGATPVTPPRYQNLATQNQYNCLQPQPAEFLPLPQESQAQVV